MDSIDGQPLGECPQLPQEYRNEQMHASAYTQLTDILAKLENIYDNV